MLNFILNNKIFEIILGIIIGINFILTAFLDSKEIKDYKEFEKLDNVTKIKVIILLIFTLITVIVLNCILKKIFLSWIIIIIITLSFIHTIKSVAKNDKCLSIENKCKYINASIIFIIFLASHSTNIYENVFQYESHITKEILLLTYLNLKIIFFTFFILINASVLISNINEILPISFKYFIKKNIRKPNNYIKLIDYDYKLYKKKRSYKNLIIDTLFFIILCPFIIITNLIYIIIEKLAIIISNIINYIIKKILLFIYERNKITKKITYISIIIALLLSYIIIINNNNLFSNEIKEIFNLVSTVLLIPIIYDSIKSTE